MPTTKSTLFLVSKDEWDTKEGTGKSVKNVLYGYGKRTLNTEKIKPIALAIAELHLKASVSQLVENSISRQEVRPRPYIYKKLTKQLWSFGEVGTNEPHGRQYVPRNTVAF